MGNKEDDITDQLLTDKEKAKEQKEKEKQKPKEEPVKRIKSETVVSETPQDRFRRIMKDQGYSTGVENITSVFFEGNTDEPSWLDEVLKLSHVPAKNREILITTYFGKTPKELGIKIEPSSVSNSSSVKTEAEKKAEEKKSDDSDVDDIIKMSESSINEQIKFEKRKLALAQMKNMSKQLEDQGKPQQVAPQASVPMRTVSRPVIGKDGNILMRDGVAVYETVTEPISQTQQNSGNDLLSTMAAFKALGLIGDTKPAAAPSEFMETIKAMQQQMNDLRKDNEVRSKEAEISRLNEKMERLESEHKRDLDKKEQDMKDKLDELNKERLRDLESLEKRFKETVEHKKEMDDMIGAISGNHKKEMDLVKKQLEHTQSSIEKTIISKGTESVSKITESMTGLVEDVAKPMADVLKDHYSTVIAKQRQDWGLPSLASTIPKLTDDDLAAFVK